MRASLIILISYFLSGTVAVAEIFNGPASAALGGAGRGGLSGAESVFLNPALVPLIQMTEVIGYYKDGQAGRHQHRNAWGVGAVDSGKDVYFPAAIHYIRSHDTGRAIAPADGEAFHLALGKNISNRLAIGASAFRLKHSVFGDRSYTQWNGSVGMLVLVTETMGVAYVLNNIAKPGSEVPMGLREDMNQGVGFYSAIAEIARVRADITRNERFNPDKKMTYMIGIESMVNEYMLFRMGFRREELTDQRIYTAGLGFNGPRMKIDYGIEKNTKGAEGAVHSVDMRVPF